MNKEFLLASFNDDLNMGNFKPYDVLQKIYSVPWIDKSGSIKWRFILDNRLGEMKDHNLKYRGLIIDVMSIVIKYPFLINYKDFKNDVLTVAFADAHEMSKLIVRDILEVIESAKLSEFVINVETIMANFDEDLKNHSYQHSWYKHLTATGAPFVCIPLLIGGQIRWGFDLCRTNYKNGDSVVVKSFGSKYQCLPSVDEKKLLDLALKHPFNANSMYHGEGQSSGYHHALLDYSWKQWIKTKVTEYKEAAEYVNATTVAHKDLYEQMENLLEKCYEIYKDNEEFKTRDKLDVKRSLYNLVRRGFGNMRFGMIHRLSYTIYAIDFDRNSTIVKDIFNKEYQRIIIEARKSALIIAQHIVDGKL